MPPSPQPPVNVVVQSSAIIEHNPSSFVVAIDFTLQQPNETSALIKDLKHEYIIMTAPVMSNATSTDLDGISTTLNNVHVILHVIYDLYNSQRRMNFKEASAIYLHLLKTTRILLVCIYRYIHYIYKSHFCIIQMLIGDYSHCMYFFSS